MTRGEKAQGRGNGGLSGSAWRKPEMMPMYLIVPLAAGENSPRN